MIKAVLDASALLALVKNEPGVEIVEKLLGSILMSTVNISEVVATLRGYEISLENIKQQILPLISIAVPLDTELALLTADLRIQTKSKGLSLGDRACLALGILKQLPIYTADKIWADLNIEGTDIRLIR